MKSALIELLKCAVSGRIFKSKERPLSLCLKGNYASDGDHRIKANIESAKAKVLVTFQYEFRVQRNREMVPKL